MGEHCKKIHLQPGCCCTCTLAIPLPPSPKKLAGSASIAGMVSGKSGVGGVDMSTPVHPVATPLITLKRYEIGCKLVFVELDLRLIPKSVSLNDPERRKNLISFCFTEFDSLGAGYVKVMVKDIMSVFHFLAKIGPACSAISLRQFFRFAFVDL